MIKLIIVDDQRLVREGLEALLNMHDKLECLAIFENGQQALESLNEIEPDVILMDIRMPVLDGIETTTKIRSSHPNVRILMLTTFDDDDYLINAMKAGANGYILKDTPVEQLMEAIQIIWHEGAYLMDSLTAKVIGHLQNAHTTNQHFESSWVDTYQLTTREMDIIQFIKKGYSNQEMAEQLFISSGTVKNHISNIMDKMDLRERSHIAIYALSGERPDHRNE